MTVKKSRTLKSATVQKEVKTPLVSVELSGVEASQVEANSNLQDFAKSIESASFLFSELVQSLGRAHSVHPSIKIGITLHW